LEWALFHFMGKFPISYCGLTNRRERSISLFFYSIPFIGRKRGISRTKGVVDAMQIRKQSMRYFNFNIPRFFGILLSIEQLLI
jgi:hypothetical protein